MYTTRAAAKYTRRTENLKSEIRNLKSQGFTLLEVVLALALTSLIVITVASAIDLHLRVLEVGRTEVEEAQLARALLRLIANDLRSAVQYTPIDLADLVPDMAISADDLAGLGEEAGADPEDLEALDESDADRTSNLTESSVVPSVPGLFGNRYELQVDTSRLPRIDQFNGMLSATGEVSFLDRPSDVKTVAYYVVNDQLDRTAYASAVSQNRNGLIRREFDRATTAWAAERGQLAEMEYGLEPIAPEVAAIEFLYYDGTEVVDEWDSIERGGLPMAVQITIGIIPSRRRNQTQAASWRTAAEQAPVELHELLIYQLLVHLPAAQPTTAEGASETSEESSEETPEESSEETNALNDLGPSQGPSFGEGPGR